MAINRKSLAVAATVFLVCFSCAHLGKNPTGMHPGVTIEPVDKEGILRLIPDEEKNGGPAFAKANIPNPFSHKELYFFHLPATARTRIELCDDDIKVVSTLIDEHMQKGVYQLSIIPAVFLLENGKYTVKLIVDEKLVGTKEFTVSRPGRFGKKPVEMHQGGTVEPVDKAGSAAAGDLTAEDRKALEEVKIKTDYILMDLRRAYEKSGHEVLKPYVPALLAGAQKFLHKPEDLGEEDEIFGDYIWLLSKTGDPRTRQFFLKLMVNDRVGGLMVAEGLLSLGKSVLPAIEDSLSSPRAQSRSGTAGYLGSMVKMDSKGVFFTPEDRKRISKRLSALLADTDEMVRRGAARGLVAMGNRLPLQELLKILENELVEIHPGVTIMLSDKRQITDEEKKSGPAFVNIPNRFPNVGRFLFHLPSAARTRIELCNDNGKVFSTLIDEHMQKGVYQLRISGALFPLENGKYTVKLIVDNKLVGTTEFAINARGGWSGKTPVEILPGVTIEPFDEADLQPFPGEENTGGPAFVINQFPSPFSNILCFYFRLPAEARTRIELCDSEGKVVSTLTDELMRKGAYKLTIDRPSTTQAGQFTLKLIVDNKLVGTKKFTILK